MSGSPTLLPWPWYSDPAVLRLEQQRVFRSAWHYAGHEGAVANSGDVLPVSAGEVPLVLVRGDDAELRAFVNVCRHRGAILVEEPGRHRSLRCPYHAWTYGLDGTLRAAPRSEREPGLELEGLSLAAARVEAWGPLLFVNADLEAPPLARALGELPALAERCGLDLTTLRFHGRVETRLASNWKLAVENFLECYHCPVAHRDFSELVDVRPDTYRLEAREGLWSQFGVARAGADGCHFHLVWPSLRVNVFPGLANLSVGPFLPAGPDHTCGFLDYFFGEDEDEVAIREFLELDDLVGAEDRRLVESVQRGVRSGALEAGFLLPESERLIRSFQARVAAELAEGTRTSVC